MTEYVHSEAFIQKNEVGSGLFRYQNLPPGGDHDAFSMLCILIA